jgi:hypothetical protein
MGGMLLSLASLVTGYVSHDLIDFGTQTPPPQDNCARNDCLAIDENHLVLPSTAKDNKIISSAK